MYFFHICHVKAFNSACYNANSCWLALHTKYCSLFFRYLIIKWNRKLLLHGSNGLKNKNTNKKKHTGIKVSVPLQGDKNPCNQCCYLPSVKTFISDNKKSQFHVCPLGKKVIILYCLGTMKTGICAKPVEDFTEDLLYLIQLSAFERLE